MITEQELKEAITQAIAENQEVWYSTKDDVMAIRLKDEAVNAIVEKIKSTCYLPSDELVPCSPYEHDSAEDCGYQEAIRLLIQAGWKPVKEINND